MAGRIAGMLRITLVLLDVAFLTTRIPLIDDHLPPWLDVLLVNGVYLVASALVLLRAAHSGSHRMAWALIGTGMLAYSLATAYSWAVTSQGGLLPFPSPADLGWLAFYPFAYAGILVFLRQTAPTRTMLLDGAVTGLGGAAVFSALVLDLLIQIQADTITGRIVDLAYPMGDSLLVGTLLARLAVGRWTGIPSGLFIAGFGSFVLADIGYLTLTATGDYTPGGVVNILYLTGLTMIAFAAWYTPRRRRAVRRLRGLGLSGWFAFGALVILLAATRERMSGATVVLAGLTLLTALLRMRRTVRELEDIGRDRHSEARRDPLTGLANRRAATEHLQRLADRNAPSVALLLLDLDGFKAVNDTHGHQIGDDLLVQVSGRLAETCRSSDVLARLGGDEFVIVLADPQLERAGVQSLAERIRDRLRESFVIADTVFDIDVSIGISLREDADGEQLLREADIAMYEAKRAGGGYRVYDLAPGLNRSAPVRPTAGTAR